MRIKVKLFATLTRVIDGAKAGLPMEIDLAEGATLNDLIKTLKLPTDQVKVTFVNGRSQDLSYVLHEGDEIGIFPPIGGG
jgi:sulfur-carrier protein